MAARQKRNCRPIFRNTKNRPVATSTADSAYSARARDAVRTPAQAATPVAIASPVPAPPNIQFIAARQSQKAWRAPTSGLAGSDSRSSRESSPGSPASRPGTAGVV
ncbi:MAG: hypothetical protein M5U30_13335 [Burkholderiaceae bacterium]|nr:hypothetical protein [Burkholderiaceae bacterium]